MTLPIDGYALKKVKAKELTANFLRVGRLFLFYSVYVACCKQKNNCHNNKMFHTHHPLARAKSVTAYRFW